jgi:lactate permease
VAAAAGNLVGKESSLFRFTAKHSFIMLGLICGIVFIQAYFLKAFIPHYQPVNTKAASVPVHHAPGYVYLLILALVIIIFLLLIFLLLTSSKKQKALQ